MTEPKKSASLQMAELKAKLEAMGFQQKSEFFAEAFRLAQLFALPQVLEVAAPGLRLLLIESERLLASLSAASEESLEQLYKRYGAPPKMIAPDTDFTRGDLVELKTQVELYNGVIESVKRYYAYNGRFPGDPASTP